MVFLHIGRCIHGKRNITFVEYFNDILWLYQPKVSNLCITLEDKHGSPENTPLEKKNIFPFTILRFHASYFCGCTLLFFGGLFVPGSEDPPGRTEGFRAVWNLDMVAITRGTNREINSGRVKDFHMDHMVMWVWYSEIPGMKKLVYFHANYFASFSCIFIQQQDFPASNLVAPVGCSMPFRHWYHWY